MRAMPIALSDWRAQACRLSHRGRAVAYFTAGDGYPLLLLHGFPTSAWDYHGQWEALAQRYRVVAFDMMGYGLSDKPADYPYSCHDQADIAETVCREIGVSRCHVLAQDVGDTICQELLARQIDGSGALEVTRVMLLNGGLFPEQHRATDFQKALLGPDADQVVPLVTKDAFFQGLRGLFGPDSAPAQAVLDGLWELLCEQNGIARWPQLIRYIEDRKRHRERWVGALIDSPLPIRLINGALDPVSGRHMAEHYQRLIPNPNVRVLEDIGHFPQLEAPGVILEEALAFFG